MKYYKFTFKKNNNKTLSIVNKVSLKPSSNQYDHYPNIILSTSFSK